VKLTPEETQNTLLQLLFERGPAGARNISLNQVAELWAETTLRRGDLLDAIVRLSAIGHLTIADSDGDTLLSLTVPGVIAARAARAPDDQTWSEHLHKTLLPRQRQPKAPSPEGSRGRRGYETGRSR
jgi:hypothetical protein